MRWLLASSLLVTACAGHPAIDDAPDGAQVVVDAGAIAVTGDAAQPGPDASTPAWLGALVEPDGVAFRVWAPDATTASVTGSFTATPMTAIGGRVFEGHVAGAKVGDDYAFSLVSGDATLTRIDPWCRQLDGASCAVTDPTTYAWQATTFVRPARTASVVYEMHVGSFAVDTGAPNGTFSSVAAALDPLADLGVNVIELMPIQDSGSGGATWGYNPQLYYAPKPAYGSADDLRALVDKAHTLGIAVWMDSVINHTDSWSQAPLRCFDATCTSGNGVYFFSDATYANTPWGPRPDYTNDEVAHMLLSATRVWVDELHGDGVRWDSIANVRALDGNGTVPGGKGLIVALNDVLHERGAFSVAEDLKGDAAITQSSSTGGFGFDSQWDSFGYNVDALLAQASDANRDLGVIATALTSTYNGDPFARLIWTEDHDTVGNGGSHLPNQIDATTPTSWAARKRSIEGALLLLTSPGVPMLFQGQDALALGTFANPAVPQPAPTAQGLQIRQFYKDMIALRRNTDGTTGGLQDTNVEIFHRNDSGKVIGYRRYGASGQDVLVVVNLANKAYTEYDIGVPDANAWRVRLNTDSMAYSDDFAAGETGSITPRVGTKDGKPYTLPLVLGAYSAMILTR